MYFYEIIKAADQLKFLKLNHCILYMFLEHSTNCLKLACRHQKKKISTTDIYINIYILNDNQNSLS